MNNIFYNGSLNILMYNYTPKKLKKNDINYNKYDIIVILLPIKINLKQTNKQQKNICFKIPKILREQKILFIFVTYCINL